jgi:hypothetical protein
MTRTEVPRPAQWSTLTGGSVERCDRCCAEGRVSVLLRSGLDLVFCAHHAREFDRDLRRSGALIETEARADALVW